ncbi:MAG: GCG_CRPN prefix-to-repeats domain-containing protein, partial [Reyranella sp.]
PRAPQFTLVAEGCGYGWWRGPWGNCRNTAYFGHMPDGSNTYPPDCPQGYWVGPWGNCRDTPFHGRLPGGDYR